jgi:hypothetical protein
MLRQRIIESIKQAVGNVAVRLLLYFGSAPAPHSRTSPGASRRAEALGL